MHGPEGCVLQQKHFWYLVILLNHKLCLGNSNLQLHRLNHFLHCNSQTIASWLLLVNGAMVTGLQQKVVQTPWFHVAALSVHH